MTPLPVSVRTDSLAERGEFELPVQICKRSDDSIKYTYQSNKACHKRTNAGVLSIDLQTGLMMTATVEPATVEPATVEPATVESAAMESVTVEFAAVESVTVEPITMESAEAFAAE
jgi:hypothetical protein